MAEAIDSLTFPMSRESESASRLKTIISHILPRFFNDYSDGVLSEYITILVCNGKSQRQARENLEAFLGEQSWEFVACLWELLIKYFFSQENPASGPKTAVDCGPQDIEQCLSSIRPDDYDHKATDDTNSMNEMVISVTAPREDIEAPVSPKLQNMKMLRQELINSPCRKPQPKAKENWNSSGYSKKILRAVIVSAINQPCGRNPDKYEKSMDERKGTLQKRLCWPEREMVSQSVSSGGTVSARSCDAASDQEKRPRLSVWDRLERPDSIVLDIEYPPLPKFRIQAHENTVFQQPGPPFPAKYSEQKSKTSHREVPTVGYRHSVFQSHKARQPKSGTITSTEPHTAYNLSRKRRYGMVDHNSGEFSIGLQYKQAEQDVEKPSLLSSQFTKPDIFSEIQNVKEKLQQLEHRIKQSKQLKKQKVEEKRSLQSGELQYQQDLSESRTVHVANVHYAAKKEAISMLFSKCGSVTNVTVVTDPVTRHPKG